MIKVPVQPYKQLGFSLNILGKMELVHKLELGSHFPEVIPQPPTCHQHAGMKREEITLTPQTTCRLARRGKKKTQVKPTKTEKIPLMALKSEKIPRQSRRSPIEMTSRSTAVKHSSRISLTLSSVGRPWRVGRGTILGRKRRRKMLLIKKKKKR